jgi:hypothetical protein
VLGWCGAVALAAVCACGSRTVIDVPSDGGSPTPTPTYTPVPQSTLAPFSVTQTAQPVPIPASTGAGAPPIVLSAASTTQVVNEIDLDADGIEIPAGTEVTTSATNGVLPGVPAPTFRHRPAAGSRRALGDAAETPIETLGVSFSQTVVLGQRPTFVFTFATGFLIAANYYLEQYDTGDPAAGWINPFEGPATINGSALLFTDANDPFTFEQNDTYYFNLYAVSVNSTPTPVPATPAPSPTATSIPTGSPSPAAGSLSVTPASFSFTAPGQTQTLSVAERGSSGTFTATVADTNIATVAKIAPGTFVVTAGSTPGTSTVVVADAQGQTFVVPFTLTITTGTISSHGRRDP